MDKLSSVYNPKESESKWYDFWLDHGFFKAGQRSEAPTYSIVIPPPNVTGNLHIGHALNNTIQDILSRWKRMQGFDVLWLPGMDHAGISTQAKVEAKLKDQGLSRYDLGREAFVERVWEWKEEFASNISRQWRSMGLSVDYSRERFTLDKGLSSAVKEVFVRLYEKGYIYRGNYIINWDPVTRTALSDIEVIHKEVKGSLYHIDYPLEDGTGSIRIATTRPETLLGDTAVAVHPEDTRYAKFIGKNLKLPFTDRLIPVVADEYVDPEFGSGAVKVTPAHDPNDFEIGKRHNLTQIIVMDESGHMNDNAGKYQGLDRFECRKQLVADLKEKGLLFKVEEHVHSVGHSERTGAVVEPYLSTQWFVSMKPLAERAIADQSSGLGVNFVPERFEKIYLHWIENVRDWCISRQLWWGHRIPAWYCDDCKNVMVSMEEPTECSKCHSITLYQDPDVLDTWFSSALWPFSTMGWPEDSEDLKRYYPTDVLITGYDIIYFWVARMIFTALEFTGEKPFDDVLITGLVRDEEGRKMSKSLGNGVDPLEIIDKYGADAMRYMLSTGCSPGNDQRFRWERVEAARNFANKIWNASRFVLMNWDGGELPSVEADTLVDRWILHNLNETIQGIQQNLERYDFGEAGRLIYNFMWDYFCDWYIEFSKLALYGEDVNAKNRTMAVLFYVLDQSLRLLHPVMPFITEEIWQQLPSSKGEASITTSMWPEFRQEFIDSNSDSSMRMIMEAITAVRNIRAEMTINPGQKIDLLVNCEEGSLAVFKENKAAIQKLCNASKVTIASSLSRPDKSLTAVVTGAELFVPLADVIDLSATIDRLKVDLKTLHAEIERVDKKLANEGFMSKAPEHVVQGEVQKREDYISKRKKVLARLEEITL